VSTSALPVAADEIRWRLAYKVSAGDLSSVGDHRRQAYKVSVGDKDGWRQSLAVEPRWLSYHRQLAITGG